MKQYRKYIYIIIFSLFVILCSSLSADMADAKTFRVKYNGSWKNYSAAIPDIFLNNKEISIKGLPVFLMNDNFMVQAEGMFQNYLNCTYTYDTSEGAVVLTRDDTTIEFYIGKKQAYVNGKQCKLAAAPQEVTYSGDSKKYIVVPFKFTAGKLGFAYHYNSSGNKIELHTIDYLNMDGVDSYPADTGFTNVIKKVRACYDAASKNDKIIITGIHAGTMAKAETVISATAGTIRVDIPATSIGTQQIDTDLPESDSIDHITLEQDEEAAHFLITFNTNVSAYSSVSGKKLTIFFEDTSAAAKVRLPENVSFDSVVDTDQYYKKRFVITIPGNHIDFYQSNPVNCVNKELKSVTYKLTAGGNTQIIFKTKTIQGYKIYADDDIFTINIDNPRNIYDKIIVLDAGHGGNDPGAQNKGTNEKDINYKVIYKYAKEYFNSETSGIKAYWTRTDDTFITLTDRAGFAKKVGADIFVSLHMNSSTSSSANGTEVYYSTLNNETAQTGLTSRRMANIMQKNLVQTLGTTDRGVKSANFVVIKSNSVPAVLIELGFLSGSGDYSKLTNPAFQKKAAGCIYETVCNIFERFPTGR